MINNSRLEEMKEIITGILADEIEVGMLELEGTLETVDRFPIEAQVDYLVTYLLELADAQETERLLRGHSFTIKELEELGFDMEGVA